MNLEQRYLKLFPSYLHLPRLCKLLHDGSNTLDELNAGNILLVDHFILL